MADVFVALAVAFALAFVTAGPKARRAAQPSEVRGAKQAKKGG